MTTKRTQQDTLLEAALEYAERGWSIFPIKFENGKKRGAFRWTRYQTEAADAKRLRRWLKDGRYLGIGVILGPVSGNLACRDFDEAEAYHEWAKKFPELAKTLPTVETARGFHVYFIAKMGKTTHYTDGELRGARSLCTLPPSPHPSCKCYRWIVPLPDGPVPKVDPEKNGFVGESVQQKKTDVTRADRAYRGKQSAKGCEDEIENAIQVTLPTGPGTRNQQVFQLARALKGIPSLANMPPANLRWIVEKWHTLALHHIETKPFEETWIDFLKGWARVLTPMRLNLMKNALAAAKADPIPDLRYEIENVRVLAALCRELQAIVGDVPFFLASRTAGRLLGVDHSTTSRWLFLLEQDDWIKTIEKGGTRENPRRATRFRYTGNGVTKEPEK